MQTYYTYSAETKRLARADRVLVVHGQTIVLGTADDFARYLFAYPLALSAPTPEPPEGKIAVPDGYELVDTRNGKGWAQKYRFDDLPTPTVADFDAAMEEHLRNEREARGYTTREPDAYANSSVPRWRQDAADWIDHRDNVMLFAQKLMNEVAAGTRPAPTMDEFKAGLPQIVWSVIAE